MGKYGNEFLLVFKCARAPRLPAAENTQHPRQTVSEGPLFHCPMPPFLDVATLFHFLHMFSSFHIYMFYNERPVPALSYVPKRTPLKSTMTCETSTLVLVYTKNN